MTWLRISSATLLMTVLSIHSASAQDDKPAGTYGQNWSATSPVPIAESKPMNTVTTSSSIAKTEPVVTIQGLCAEKVVRTCETVVTRGEFEKLLDSMNVTGKTLTAETRRNLAETYAQYLVLAREATKAGLEESPQFAEIMSWWRLRTLADLYRGSLAEQFKKPSRDEIHAYYLDHLQSYQRIRAARVIVPRTMGETEEAQRSDKKALELANSARRRVLKGEDTELVQKDVYSTLQMPSPPTTDLGTHPRSNFPVEESDELFALEPGQVSKVETEGASYVIYKMVKKETQPEDAVKEEISRLIAQSKYDEAMRKTKESATTEINDAYFGPPSAAPSAAHANPLTSSHP